VGGKDLGTLQSIKETKRKRASGLKTKIIADNLAMRM